MSVKVLQWSRRVLVPHPSSRQRCQVSNGGEPLVCRFPPKFDHRPSVLQWSRSCESTISTSKLTSGTSTARLLFSFSDKEFPGNADNDDGYDDRDSNATDQSCSHEEASDEKKDGDSCFNQLNVNHRTLLPDGGAQLSEQEEKMMQLREEDSLWRSIVEEAWGMEDRVDRETMKQFVAPLGVEIEPDNCYKEHFETEEAYPRALIKEPHNPLLLVTHAQFLYVVFGDYDRAEEWLERAIEVKEEDGVVRDAEAYRKYGEFKRRARKHLLAAHNALFESFCLD